MARPCCSLWTRPTTGSYLFRTIFFEPLENRNQWYFVSGTAWPIVLLSAIFSEYLLTMHRSRIMNYDSTFKNELLVLNFHDDNDCFYYHSWIYNTSSAFETLSSFIVVTLQLNNCTNVLKIIDSKANEASSEAIRLFLMEYYKQHQSNHE